MGAGISAVLTLLTGLWWITVVTRLPSAVRHARQRQETIERLRRDGRRFSGSMRTSPDRVPADGSPVVVFDDLRGVVHVELDVDAEPTFEPEARYTAAE